MIIKMELGNNEHKLYDGCTDIQYAKHVALPTYLEEGNCDFCPTRYKDLYMFVQSFTFGKPTSDMVTSKDIECDFYGPYEAGAERKYSLIQFNRGNKCHYVISPYSMQICSDAGYQIETL
jgi:hypothetical protein